MHGLDLNLLTTLDALLAERSVTGAAARLGLSQPAVSHALARLREELGDPLLVRHGRTMVPTPRAEALEPALRATLHDLRRLVERGADFDPATARGTFSLAAPDALAVVVPAILDALAEAPHLSLELRRAPASLGDVSADVVLDVLPSEAPGLVSRRLGALREQVAMRQGHPALSAPWDLDAYLAWPHVLIRTGRGGPSVVERALEGVGRVRRVGLQVETWLLAPHAVSGTNLLFTGAAQLLAPLVEPLGLVLREPPIPLPDVPIAALWPERLQADPGHRWFRGRVVRVVQGMLGEP